MAPATVTPGTPDSAGPPRPGSGATVWAAVPRRVRWGVGLAVAVGVAVWAVGPSAGPEAAGRDADAETAMARAQWAAMMRRAPTPLTRAGRRDTLGPGDAERTDGRYADYYVYAAPDSAVFSVVVASAEFAPDLAVRRPDGATVAASTLLRTGTRAEVAGLRGPGRFEIAVTSREPGATGAYELTAGASPVADSLYADGPARGDTLGRGALGGTLRAGRFERVYGVVAGSEAPVIIRVVSPAFMPRLSLLGPTGEVEGAWRTMERRSSGDSLYGVVLRYLPGWDSPYRLVVSSEAPRARGPFAVDVRTLPVRTLAADGRGLSGTLGDDSWLDGYRYVDMYRFTVRDGMRTLVEATSEAVPPALRLYRQDRRAEREAIAALNPGGTSAARIEQTLPAGEYVLEVTSGGSPADTTRALGGDYALVVRQTPLAPPPPRPGSPARPPAAPTGPLTSRVFSVSGERTGTSGGSTFAVGATQVAVSYPGGRTRVQVSASVRSVDYTGAWAPWSSFARKSYLIDDAGRRYAAAPGESASPSGGQAEPGMVRRGTVVFYTSGAATGQRRFVLVASIGESSVTLPLSVP